MFTVHTFFYLRQLLYGVKFIEEKILQCIGLNKRHSSQCEVYFAYEPTIEIFVKATRYMLLRQANTN